MGISLWQLLIILVIVVLLFGTKRLKNIGSDLGGAIKGFKKAMTDSENDPNASKANLEGPAPTQSAELQQRSQDKTPNDTQPKA